MALDAAASAKDEKAMPLCRAGELGALWTRGGLTAVVERPLEFEMRFESLADYWEPFLLGQGPAGAYVRTLPSEQVGRLRQEARRRLGVTDDTSAIRMSARLWAVRGNVPIL